MRHEEAVERYLREIMKEMRGVRLALERIAQAFPAIHDEEEEGDEDDGDF